MLEGATGVFDETSVVTCIVQEFVRADNEEGSCCIPVIINTSTNDVSLTELEHFEDLTILFREQDE